jgi:hypothetical protein
VEKVLVSVVEWRAFGRVQKLVVVDWQFLGQ